MIRAAGCRNQGETRENTRKDSFQRHHLRGCSRSSVAVRGGQMSLGTAGVLAEPRAHRRWSRDTGRIPDHLPHLLDRRFIPHLDGRLALNGRKSSENLRQSTCQHRRFHRCAHSTLDAPRRTRSARLRTLHVGCSGMESVWSTTTLPALHRRYLHTRVLV